MVHKDPQSGGGEGKRKTLGGGAMSQTPDPIWGRQGRLPTEEETTTWTSDKDHSRDGSEQIRKQTADHGDGRCWAGWTNAPQSQAGRCPGVFQRRTKALPLGLAARAQTHFSQHP